MTARFARVAIACALLPILVWSATAGAEIEQEGNLRVRVVGQLQPRALPREGKAPVSVSVGWRIDTADGMPPPTLKKLRIEINRNGVLNLKGLPTCPYAKIQPASTSRALAGCRPALVGRGSFSAMVGLAGQEPAPTKGKMVVFNGLEKGKPALFGHIYSPHPFASSFVIVFRLEKLGRGTYGTALTATLPATLRSWGSLSEVEMKLSRRFRFRGARQSVLSAGCPAPKGFGVVGFNLAQTSFNFAGVKPISTTLVRNCRAKGK